MKIGEVDLASLGEIKLERLRFPNPDNHLGSIHDLSGPVNNFSTGLNISPIFETAGAARSLFHQNRVSVLHHDLNACRGHGDTILFGLGFFHDAYNHI